MGKIACICGKPGRVQHTRMKFLRDNYLPYLDVYADDVPDLSKYEVVYFSHYSLAKKHRCRDQAVLASVTSHKYDKKELMKFDRISVNNRILMGELQEFKPALTENGVDTKFWKPPEPWTVVRPCRMTIGWVGNTDRAAKRYSWYEEMSVTTPEWLWTPVVTSKKDRCQPFTPEQMREYYWRLDALLVTSESEGTPNPALEAMACGTPVVCTRVGNLVDMESRGVFRYESTVGAFYNIGLAIGRGDSGHMARCQSYDWDWSIKYKAWDNFFKEWL